MAKLKKFRQDTGKEVEGVWVPFEDGIEFLIANVNSKRFQDYLRKITKPHLRMIRNGTAAHGLQTSLFKNAASKYLVLGWKNIENEDGSDLEYSPDACLEIFNDEELRPIFEFVVEAANAGELFRQEFDDESEGN